MTGALATSEEPAADLPSSVGRTTQNGPNLTPEQFRSETSAVRVNVRDDRHDNSTEGFYHWIKENLEGTRLVIDVADVIPMFAVLASADESRVFVAGPHEKVKRMIDRLRDEATKMHANWLYIAVRSQASIGRTYDLATSAGKSALAKDEQKQEVVNWYAEQREPDPVIEFGSIQMETLEHHVYRGDDPRGAHPLFKMVLGDA